MREADTLKLHRRQAFAGFLIVGLIAIVGFAAFSATGFRNAPPIDIPADATADIAGQLLAVDLGPDAPEANPAPAPATPGDSGTATPILPSDGDSAATSPPSAGP